jgi:hypothetical protein
MSEIKLTKTGEQKFTPIKVNIEFTINSQLELDDIREEFISGEFDEITTQYSSKLYDILYKLKEL